MFYQVQNSKLKRNNQFRVQTIPSGLKEIKARGWKVADCKISELARGLVLTKYKSPDGKNTI